MLVLFFSHQLPLLSIDHRGPSLDLRGSIRIQFLKSLRMLLLELPLFLLEDRMVLLDLVVFGLQALEFLREFGQPSLGSISGHGSLGGLVLHHRGMFAKN